MADKQTWKDFSERSSELYKELKSFADNKEMKRLLSSNTILHIRKAMSEIKEFRYKAEEEMIKKGEPENTEHPEQLDIWFPSDQ